jgi:hypothetical protein
LKLAFFFEKPISKTRHQSLYVFSFLLVADLTLSSDVNPSNSTTEIDKNNQTDSLKTGTRDKRGLDMDMPMFIIRPVENRKRIIIHDPPHSMSQKPKVYSTMGAHSGNNFDLSMIFELILNIS